MSHLTDLRVFNETRQNIRSIAKLCDSTRGFGDLHNQAKRAAISVASNIAEGLGSSTIPQTKKFLHIARASNHELHAQLLIISDLHPHKDLTLIIENITYVGKMLTRLIQGTG